MSPWRLFWVAPAAVTVALGLAAAAELEPVPLFTSEDLDRMFGPAPARPSEPVDKARPEDWRWVEQFIDRQYSRIDADRRFDLDSRAMDIAATRIAPARPLYGWPAWGLRYPASTWWNTVASKYGVHTYGNGHDEIHGRRDGGIQRDGRSHRSPHARRAK